MRGSIYKRPNGTFEAIVEGGYQLARRCDRNARHRIWVSEHPRAKTCPKCDGSLGEPTEERRQRRRTFRTRGAAQDALTEMLSTAAGSGDLFPSSLTVREFVARWVKERENSGKVRPRTLRRYQELLAHVLPYVGELKIAKARASHIQYALGEVAASDLSPTTVAHVRTVLSGLFRSAERLGLVTSNPVTATEVATIQRAALTVLEPRDLRALIEAAEGTTWAMPMLIAATTGLRRGEVLGLRWSEVDLDTARLQVVRSLQTANGEIVAMNPKTTKSRRTVSLPATAVDRLRRHRAEQAARRLRLGQLWQETDLVCERGDGAPFHPDSFSKGFRRIAEAAGSPPGARLHDVRHGYATALLANGVHPLVASNALGHSSAAFTMSTYQHVLPDQTDAAAAALEAVLRTAR